MMFVVFFHDFVLSFFACVPMFQKEESYCKRILERRIREKSKRMGRKEEA